ncbi:MAG: hypothetical protein ACI4O4_08675 [Candidatus Ventricola sp.]
MSRTKHRQHGGARQWNPPPIPPETRAPFSPPQNVVSATDCTGLEAQPVLSDSAAEHVSALYAIHAQKPQGNIGKDNPNNDPSEINFHRTEP